MLLPKSDGSGRVAAYEILIATHAVRNLIRRGQTTQISTYMGIGQKEGMRTLEQSLAQLVQKGVISEEVAQSRVPKKLQLEQGTS
jgi:twitching motility protein PilT